jgi:hypothetical protein
MVTGASAEVARANGEIMDTRVLYDTRRDAANITTRKLIASIIKDFKKASKELQWQQKNWEAVPDMEKYFRNSLQ